MPGLAQLAFAPLVVRRPSRRLLLAATVLNVVTIVLWGLARTVGLPFPLAEVEPVGRLDLVATAAELVLVDCCVAAVAGGRSRGRAAA